MNIYDTKIIKCANCHDVIGEIESDAQVIRPLCGKCANPLPEGDQILYTISQMKQTMKPIIVTN